MRGGQPRVEVSAKFLNQRKECLGILCPHVPHAFVGRFVAEAPVSVQPHDNLTVETDRVRERVDHPLVVAILPRSITSRREGRGSDGQHRRVRQCHSRIRREAVDPGVIESAADDRQELGDFLCRRVVPV